MQESLETNVISFIGQFHWYFFHLKMFRCWLYYKLFIRKSWQIRRMRGRETDLRYFNRRSVLQFVWERERERERKRREKSQWIIHWTFTWLLFVECGRWIKNHLSIDRNFLAIWLQLFTLITLQLSRTRWVCPTFLSLDDQFLYNQQGRQITSVTSKFPIIKFGK